MNPVNTGWNDFWFQCQDPEKDVDDCVGTVAVGIASIGLGAFAIIGATISSIAMLPMGGTVIGLAGFPTQGMITGALGSV